MGCTALGGPDLILLRPIQHLRPISMKNTIKDNKEISLKQPLGGIYLFGEQTSSRSYFIYLMNKQSFD